MGPSERFFICESGQRSLRTILGANFYGQQHARPKIPVTVQRLEWSINGLAIEFGLDRGGTAARRLHDVPPVKIRQVKGGHIEKSGTWQTPHRLCCYYQWTVISTLKSAKRRSPL